jgi:hypothetical protein
MPKLKMEIHDRERSKEAKANLAKKLGMVQVEFIKDADFFKGATSDEFVFSKVFS